ncbi:LOW QUALITY PROTEIN: hypothetical protein EUGRSUZ_D00218 [Eucalyptus grandis]|uniref:Uncharacterized protein n=1 Tax=Eucalyptus grandis TaxID=71139 RepID=A0ACC3L229_EUCGR|nr:LOW QUALITY PROTEIN: hypothetical protein EUGRSUZ_D00218 [Eucalyptus grandis]
MGFELLDWYCRPVASGNWAGTMDSAFGAYTPCAVDSLVISISHLLLLGLCYYRIWLIKRTLKVQRYRLRSKCYNYMLGLLSFYCAAEPLLRLVMGSSVFNLDGQTILPPYEMVSLTIESLAWCSMLVMIGLEMHAYIREFKWYVRFGLIYVLVGQVVMFKLILSMRDHYQHHSLPSLLKKQLLLGFINYGCQLVIFGILLFVYEPSLDPYPGYTTIPTEPVHSVEYEALPGEEQVCPERHVNIFSNSACFSSDQTSSASLYELTWTYFGWVTPLMQQGYKRPISEKDVWKLDTWDQTETLIKRFQKCWAKESHRPKPWLLRALNSSLGGSLIILSNMEKLQIGSDLSRFAGPTLLNYLLQSMQRGDPAWIGYICAFLILVSVSFGVLCQTQFYQNSSRVGFRLRSTLVKPLPDVYKSSVSDAQSWSFSIICHSRAINIAYSTKLVAAIFRKSLRLTHEGRKKFQSGKITNMMTTDANALETIIISKMQKLTKKGLQSTDKRVSVMNEILAAMDTVKCYAWEKSFQCKVQEVRSDELSWFHKFWWQFNGFVLNSIPVIVTVVSFGTFTLLGGNLTPARAFTSLSLFAVLRFPLDMLPSLMSQVVTANVSLQRLEELLLTEERVLIPNPAIEPGEPAISIKDGHFSWDSKVK